MDDYRRHLYDALHEASRDYDQAILTLAAASLALSVTFGHDIAPTPVPSTHVLLVGAWVSLAVSMVAILLSFLTSQRVLRDQIASLDRQSDLATTPEPMAEPATGSAAARMTEILNGTAGGALIAGLLVLGWFALANT